MRLAPRARVQRALQGREIDRVPLTAYRMGEILNAEELPLKYVGLSSCFRREAGAAGKDSLSVCINRT